MSQKFKKYLLMDQSYVFESNYVSFDELVKVAKIVTLTESTFRLLVVFKPLCIFIISVFIRF